ncbi:MBL fold metallo-hydrolase [Paludifilum halophilum]|uniref:Metallo-beta-lactamase domain-containing protein n=1 Tax=Paludifilum halophilum TaxID=1642702 RepID=A0A235BBX9_9BACL|nr:MBL fold metallo-hydrolase [Paludifilum halophilum]OYD09529.1 hypothetical protein CHM34_00475 [Paludifilum halophilum]
MEKGDPKETSRRESLTWTVLGYQSPYPGSGGATPGYLLEGSGHRILVDCGSGVLSQLGRYVQPWELDAVWLSHLHHDHLADFFVLQYALQTEIRLGKRKQPLPVFAPTEPERWGKQLSYRDAVRLHPIGEERTWKHGEMQVACFRTEHPVPCYAMDIQWRGKRILYGADAGPETDWERADPEPDLFICEGTFLDRDASHRSSGHHTVKEAAEAAERIGARRLLLTHLYPGYSRREIEAEAKTYYSGDLLLAEIGCRVRLI